MAGNEWMLGERMKGDRNEDGKKNSSVFSFLDGPDSK